MYARLVDQTSERYRSSGRVAFHFARGKLRRDPVYEAVFSGGFLSAEGTLLDLGCGGGLLLALLATAARTGVPTPRLIGVETRLRAAAVARAALGEDGEIVTADARVRPLPRARTIVLFDVLSMMPAADQDALLRAVVEALESGGLLLVRDADAGAGWRFRSVGFANRFKAWALRTRGVHFHFRTREGWREWLEEAGLSVEAFPMGRGTPFGNVLFAARKR